MEEPTCNETFYTKLLEEIHSEASCLLLYQALTVPLWDISEEAGSKTPRGQADDMVEANVDSDTKGNHCRQWGFHCSRRYRVGFFIG